MNDRNQRSLRPLLCALLVSGAPGCDDPLTDPSLIAGPRIVGARVVTAADPGLAEPAAGQAASIEWLLLSNRAGPLSASVAWCRAAPSVLGPPRCEGAPFSEQRASGRWGEPLRLEFSVPGDLEPGSAWLAWLGVCVDADLGEAVAPPRFASDAEAGPLRCTAGELHSGFYRGFVPESIGNRNPSLADDVLTLDGVSWPPPAVDLEPLDACLGAGLPPLRAGQDASLRFELGGDDREPLGEPPGAYAARPRESLVYTHLASHALLERAFSAIDYDAQALAFEVPIAPAAAPGPEGEAVSFYILVRDERGGVDWTQRQACLLPP